MTVSQVSYGGVYLPQTTAAAVAWAQGNLNPAQLTEFYAPSWPGQNRTHLPFTGPCFPPFQIGTLHWPQGASRFAVAHFFITDSQLSELRNYLYSPGHNYYTSRPLVMADDLGGTITTPMYLLPPHPLAQLDRLPPPLKQLYLMTLVDARYFWWEVPAALPVVAGTTTWIQLLASISTALAVPITVGAIPTAYLKPPASLTSYYEWLPPLLDAVCACIGQRLIRKLDGTVETQLATAALTKQRAQFTTFGTKLQAGGHLLLDATKTPNDLNGLVPAKVGVAFAHAACDVQTPSYFSQVALADLALPEFRSIHGYPSTHLFHDSAQFSGSITGPENKTELDALARQIATDFYRWRLGFVEAKWPGIKAWVPGGLDDVVEWTHGEGEVSTRVYRNAWNSEPLELCHYSSVTADDCCCMKYARIVTTSPGSVPAYPYGTGAVLQDLIYVDDGGGNWIPTWVDQGEEPWVFDDITAGTATVTPKNADGTVPLNMDGIHVGDVLLIVGQETGTGMSAGVVTPHSEMVTVTSTNVTAIGLGTVGGGILTGGSITQAGSGYAPGSLAFTTSGGGGSGATGTATVNASGSVIGPVVVTSAGSGYTSAPTLVFPSPGGATATGTGTVATGALTGGSITQGGSNYAPGPISFTTLGGGGSGGTGTATVNADGVVVGPVLITAAGAGYTSAPTLVFPVAPGVPTTFTATFLYDYTNPAVIYTAGIWLIFANNTPPNWNEHYLGKPVADAPDHGRVYVNELTATERWIRVIQGGNAPDGTYGYSATVQTYASATNLWTDVPGTTTVAATINAGVQTVTPAGMDSIAPGTVLLIVGTYGEYGTTPPDVTFSSPAIGTTATGVAVLGDGKVVSVTITDPGSGYTDDDMASVFIAGGLGAGATATVTIDSGTGLVTGVTITYGGDTLPYAEMVCVAAVTPALPDTPTTFDALFLHDYAGLVNLYDAAAGGCWINFANGLVPDLAQHYMARQEEYVPDGGRVFVDELLPVPPTETVAVVTNVTCDPTTGVLTLTQQTVKVLA